jgi:hypothetical protein
MKKKEITEEGIKNLIKDYCENFLNSNKLSEKYDIPKKRVLLILKENNVEKRNSGRLYAGGVIEANRRYVNKPGIKDKKRKIHKDWAEKHGEYLKDYHRQWREKNIDKWKKIKRNYEKTRKSNDPIYKLIGNFRTAMYTVLKENNLTKNNHYFEILGYTQMELVNHLEKLFNNGMTWENYGEWHVDHKLPITSFNFNDINDDEFKKCWSLGNLQPMWGSENISKSNKIFV